jgi:hypothetical protein
LPRVEIVHKASPGEENLSGPTPGLHVVTRAEHGVTTERYHRDLVFILENA